MGLRVELDRLLSPGVGCIFAVALRPKTPSSDLCVEGKLDGRAGNTKGGLGSGASFLPIAGVEAEGRAMASSVGRSV